MRALIRKSVGEAWPLLVALVALLFFFQWIQVWLTSLLDLGAVGIFLQSLPPVFEAILGISFKAVATPTGRVAIGYVHPVLLFGTAAWCVARGSDVVSGEIGRGTMEMLLAQPVRRLTVLLVPVVVTTLGSLILCVAAWCGTSVGLWWVGLAREVSPRLFLPAAANLFGAMFFLAGMTTLLSSFDRFRWRTIGLMGGFYIVEIILKVVARAAPRFDWLMYLTFDAAFEPQALAISPDTAWSTLARYDGVLLGLGLAAYFGAAVVFCRRDIPPPL